MARFLRGALALRGIAQQLKGDAPSLMCGVINSGIPSTSGTGFSSASPFLLSGIVPRRWMSFPVHLTAGQEFVSLNNIHDNPGARGNSRRVGRGIGSSKGKTAGRGHKGQKARTGRTPREGFEGGQTPLRLRVPKRGFHNPFSREYREINLARLAEWIAEGRLDASRVITMRDLRDSGAVGRRIRDGVKLLARGGETLPLPVHLQVSAATPAAREAVEAAGGSVTTVYYNTLGLRALTTPDWFPKKGRLLPRPARIPPRLQGKFDARGDLPPLTELPPRAPGAA